jgi:hypothetical protein
VKILPPYIEDAMFNVINHSYYIVISTILTFFILYAEDFRILFFNQSADKAINIFFCLSFGFFLLDSIWFSLAQKGYFNSFQFYIEVLATMTILMDL